MNELQQIEARPDLRARGVGPMLHKPGQRQNIRHKLLSRSTDEVDKLLIGRRAGARFRYKCAPDALDVSNATADGGRSQWEQLRRPNPLFRDDNLKPDSLIQSRGHYPVVVDGLDGREGPPRKVHGGVESVLSSVNRLNPTQDERHPDRRRRGEQDRYPGNDCVEYVSGDVDLEPRDSRKHGHPSQPHSAQSKASCISLRHMAKPATAGAV